MIAVEGDWPDCYRVNRYVKGYPDSGRNAHEVLHAFNRWPTWMWANEEVVTLAEWLRHWNRTVAADHKVGFYGLDVYSLWDSMHAVLDYLRTVDGVALAATRRAFECFEPFGYDVDQYAHATAWTPRTCEKDVVDMLRKLREQTPDLSARRPRSLLQRRTECAGGQERGKILPHDGPRRRALLERPRRTHGRNAQPAHRPLRPAKRKPSSGSTTRTSATPATPTWRASGMVNVGQLVRNSHAADGVVLVGFSSHRGTVIASQAWGDAMRVLPVPPARPGSWEDVLHHADAQRQVCSCSIGSRPLSNARAARTPGDRRRLPTAVRSIRQLRAERSCRGATTRLMSSRRNSRPASAPRRRPLRARSAGDLSQRCVIYWKGIP